MTSEREGAREGAWHRRDVDAQDYSELQLNVESRRKPQSNQQDIVVMICL